MHKIILLLASAYVCAGQVQAFEPSICFANKMTTASWNQDISDSFNTSRLPPSTLITQLLSCLHAPDPSVRDDIGYMGLATLIRSEQVEIKLLRQAFNQLLMDISAAKDNDEGVYIPFAILALSEVIRADRITPYLTSQQRSDVINTIDLHLKNLNDYRGFDDQDGWRHHVAHSADVLLQMAVNEKISAEHLQQMGDIILRSIRANSMHFYHFNEPKRLARAMTYILMREEVAMTHWQAEIARAIKPQGFANWGETYKSEAALAQQHNVYAFFSALTTYISYQENARLTELAPKVAELARTIG